MSDTPRTNNYVADFPGSRREPRLLDFARQLENELAEAEKKVFAYKTALELAESELIEARAEIERLRGVIISQITPEPLVLSSYSTTTEPAKDERDKLIEQMREIINDYRIEHKAWCNHDPDNAKECTCGLSEKVQAALAAERVM